MRRCLINEPSLIKHGYAIVKIEMANAMRDRNHSPLVGGRNVVQQMHNFVFRFRVEPAGDFVAQEQQRRADHLQGEGEPPLLSTGKNTHPAIGDIR